MDTADLTTVRDLVLDSSLPFKEAAEIEEVDVVERLDSDGGATLLIRIKADPHQSQRHWTETRLRLAQRIRDELLKIGESRYPVLSIYSPSEWKNRDK